MRVYVPMCAYMRMQITIRAHTCTRTHTRTHTVRMNCIKFQKYSAITKRLHLQKILYFLKQTNN